MNGSAHTVQIDLHARDSATATIKGVMGGIQQQISALLAPVAAMAGTAGLGALVKKGVEFNRTMEDTKGGIAGVLLMTREYVNEAGKVVTGQEAMNAAFAEASTIQEKLKKDALGTAASYTELVQAFQNSVGPATAAGVKNLDDVREITVMATQAMAALGIPTAQAAQELRGLFAGDMGPDNRLNQVLRITKADITALGGDAEAVAALFKERLGPAASVAAMQTGTLTVRLSNLGDILDQVMGKATASIFRELSDAVVDVIEWIERVGPAAQAAGDSLVATFKAALGPIEEVGRSVLGFIDARVQQSGGTWAEVFQGFAVVFNNVMAHIRSGWVVVINALIHPLDTLRLVFGNLLGNILSMLADVASKVPAFLGGREMEGWLRGAAEAVDKWGTENSEFLAGVEAGLARTEAAWEANEKAIVGTGKATDGLAGAASRAKKGAEEAGAAGVHFGTVWAAESTKAAAALMKFGEEFATFTGDVAGAAIARIEKEYQDLVGQLGELMFEAKVPFAKGLEMLERLAEEKGRKIVGAIFNGEAAVEEMIGVLERKRHDWQRAIEDIFKFQPDDAGAGAKAGFFGVFAALPSAAESAAAAVQGVWQSMARSFDDLFFNVLSGRLDNLKDVFRNLWESLLQTFSRYLSDMLQRWIATQTAMAETPAPGSYPGAGASGGTSSSLLGKSNTWGSMGAGYTNGGGWGGALVGAGVGLGIGSMVGQVGGGKYNQTGGQIGGAIGGAIFGVVGALVGALLGTAIGALLSPNTERHLKGSLGAMVGATRWEWIQPRGTKPGGKPWDPEGGEGDPGELPPGFWRGFLESPANEAERAGARVFEAQTATFASIFRMGAKDQASELMAAYQKALKDALSGANFDIAAGSKEDIEKDWQYVLSTLLPRIGLSAAFGQTGYLPPGDRDLPGGIPGVMYGMPGMNEDGTWASKQLFDPEAPIPKMLAGLGFTAEKIGELASRISTDDPAKLLAYIQGAVGVVVGLRDLGVAMGKSFSELAKSWSDEAAAGPAAALGKQAQEIADAFDALSLYSGDEQVQKAQEALALSDQFWSSVESYLRQVQASIEKMSASLQSQRSAMRDFLNPETEGQRIDRLMGEIDGVWGKLAKAVDPAEVEKVVGEAQAAIDAVFKVMAERVTRGKALLTRLADLDRTLGELSNFNLGADTLASNPIAVMGEQLVDIQERVTAAAQLSGLAQIEAIEGVAQSTEELAANLRSLFAEIASVSASINKSIDSQIWELGVGELDATGQAGAITERIRQLQEQLKIATSPAEIQAITSEIQSLTGRYVSQFGQDDPARAEAVRWAQEQLERARGLANEALDLLRQQAEQQAAELREMMKGAAGLISGNVTEAAGVIGQLSHTLGELDRIMQETMTRLGDGILASLEPLRIAMEGAAGIFTGATQTAGNALTAPTTGLADSTDRAAASARAFAENLDRALPTLARLAALGGPSGGQTPNATAAPPAASQTASVDARAVIPLVRRYAYATVPRTY